MDCLEAMRTRRSIRTYKPQKVTDQQLAYVLEAAQNAPSWKNMQPTTYIVVRDRAKIQKMKEIYPNPKGNAHEAADCFLVLCADPERSGYREGKPYYMADAAISLTQVTLAAHAMGLGTCWVGVFPEQEIKALFGIPYHIRVVAMTPLGVPAEAPNATMRKPLSQLAFENTWNEPLRDLG